MLVLVAGIGNLVASNRVASQRFAIDLKKKELHAEGNALAAREMELGDSVSMTNLISLVQRNGMVPDLQGTALFLTTGVAYTNGFAQGQN